MRALLAFARVIHIGGANRALMDLQAQGCNYIVITPLKPEPPLEFRRAVD
jgi:hypothetical protein